ncbi:amino acid permease [Sulfobacillus sp. hq2]|nr:amino acid permease [Sulfobacillus sp. hq2]
MLPQPLIYFHMSRGRGERKMIEPGSNTRPYQLDKVVGVIAIMASALSQEYGSGINFVATQSLSVYPRIEYLVPLAMFVTGLFYLPKVFLFMRFGKVMPRAGGSYVWITRSLGMQIGFIVHFLWWASLAFAIGVLAFAFGTFLSAGLVSAGLPGATFFVTPWGHILAGAVAIWLIFWMHYRGIGHYAKLVTILMGVVILTAAIVIAVGFSNTPATFAQAVHTKLHVSLVAPTTFPAPSLSAFLSVCTLFIFAYGGISAAPFLGGEAKDSTHSIPLGIFWGWLSAIVLFSLVSLAIFHAAPWWGVVTLIHHGDTAYATTPGLVGLLGSPSLAAALNLLVALIVGKTLAPQMMGTSRLVFAWAQDHLFPARFAKTSKWHTPAAALFLSAVIGTLSLIQSALVGWSIGVTFRSIAILLVLALLGIGVLNLRWGSHFRHSHWREPIAHGWAVVIAAVLGIIIAALLISSVLIVPKTPVVFQPAFQAVVAILVGTAIYHWSVAHAKKKGIHIHAIAEDLPLE